MAEIRLEEKSKGGSMLPWIIGLLLLGLIIWGVAEAFDESDETTTENEVLEGGDAVAPVATGIDENNNYKEFDAGDAAIGEDDQFYTGFMSSTENMEGEMGLGHEFTNQTLTQLANASAALAERKGVDDGTSADSKAMRVKQLAGEITADPMATDHADKIKMSTMLITEILEDVDQKAYNGQFDENVKKLRQEAQAIDASTLTLDQKSDVRSFFRQARLVLQEMK